MPFDGDRILALSTIDRLLFMVVVEYDYIVILKYISVFVCFLLFPLLQTKYCLNGLEETVLYILWKQAF